MNIFVLDTDPCAAASMQCDKHVVKMPLESAQMLSTVQRDCGNDDETLYRPTHRHHPCTVWAGQSQGNYAWLFDHFDALCQEYTHRYSKTHLSWTKLASLLRVAPTSLPDIGLTPFAQAMPDEYKHDDPVTAYRAYYINEKAPLLVYTRREPPSWLRVDRLSVYM